jgi:peptidoglycan hydrolase-like protein with peptidoglycan-binding domain
MPFALGITADHNLIARAARKTAWPPRQALGYLGGMRIGLLAALSIPALVTGALIAARPALGQDSTSSAHPLPAVSVRPLPAAGWHGRAIRDPRPRRPQTGVAATPAATPVATLQRRLWRLGYRPGPVDGLAGPLTRAAIQWFQIKHGLRPSGIADVATVREMAIRLRLRTTTAARHVPQGAPTTSPPLSPVAPLPPAAHPRPAGGHRTLLLILVAGLLALVLLALPTVVTRWPRRRSPAPWRPAPEPSAPARRAAARARPQLVTLGYAGGSDPAEADRHAGAIRRECVERGWVLAGIVRELGAPGRARTGLAHALAQLAELGATRLVVARLADLGGAAADLNTTLRRCAGRQVDVVALDVGLDTGTAEGRMAAQCLLAIGGNGRRVPAPPTARSRRRGRGRRAESTPAANAAGVPGRQGGR